MNRNGLSNISIYVVFVKSPSFACAFCFFCFNVLTCNTQCSGQFLFFVYEITPNTNIETRGDKLLWNNVGGMLCIPCNTALWNKLCDTLCKSALTMLYNGRYDWLHYNGSQYAGIRCKTVILQSKHRAARRSLIRDCSDFLICSPCRGELLLLIPCHIRRLITARCIFLFAWNILCGCVLIACCAGPSRSLYIGGLLLIV